MEKKEKILGILGKIGLGGSLLFHIFSEFNVLENSSNLYGLVFIISITLIYAGNMSKRYEGSSSALFFILIITIILILIPVMWLIISPYLR